MAQQPEDGRAGRGVGGREGVGEREGGADLMALAML